MASARDMGLGPLDFVWGAVIKFSCVYVVRVWKGVTGLFAIRCLGLDYQRLLVVTLGAISGKASGTP